MKAPASQLQACSVGLMGGLDRPRWDRFVEHCAQATLFHRSGWQTVIEQAFGHPSWYLYAERAGQIAAILPLAQVRSRLFGNTLCSLPFCVGGGIAATDEAAAGAVDLAAQDLARRLQVDHLEYRHQQLRHPEWPRKSIYAGFSKALLPDADANLLAIPRKQRAMIRKGQALGLRSVIDADSARLTDAYSRSVHRLGTPMFAADYFSLLQQQFGSDCEILTVEHGRQTVCSVLSFHFRGTVLPYYGGGGALARNMAGNDFMYWEVMRRACEQGRTTFDFGRSKYGTGAYQFKKNWGFVAQPLEYECQLHRSRQLHHPNPLQARYHWPIRLWRCMPLALANALGPYLIRQLG